MNKTDKLPVPTPPHVQPVKKRRRKVVDTSEPFPLTRPDFLRLRQLLKSSNMIPPVRLRESVVEHLIVNPERPDPVVINEPETSRPTTEVFDFAESWHLVEPHLNNLDVASTLHYQMDDFIETRRIECEINGWDNARPFWEKEYDPVLGPWYYTTSDFWENYVDELMDEAVDREEFTLNCGEGDEPSDEEWKRYETFRSQFYPKPDTFNWFQLRHGCFWMAPWLQQLGKVMFPDLCWKVAEGANHSFAFATDGRGNIVWIFDILLFQDRSATELIDFINEPLEDGAMITFAR